MAGTPFRLPITLPAQGAAEPDAVILQWRIAEGDSFRKGQPLAEIESAKASFDFEAPCDGTVIKIHYKQGDTIPYDVPVLEIETTDEFMRTWQAGAAAEGVHAHPHGQSTAPAPAPAPAVITTPAPAPAGRDVYLRSVAGYLPRRVVPTAELLANFESELTAHYMVQVTGIEERRWADADEKPSTMALAAAQRAIAKAGLTPRQIDAIIVATTTPDQAMPSTACLLQEMLGVPRGPAFDLNAACSGWLYAVATARGLIATGLARNVLAIGVELQSRLLDMTDRNTCFIFGDGAGAGVISADGPGHRIAEALLDADGTKWKLGYRNEPGYYNLTGDAANVDRTIRLDGPGMFRAATVSFAQLVRDVTARSGWDAGDVRLVVPHQANSRILEAAAKRAGVPFERFFVNVNRVGNTSSASIPLALSDAEAMLRPGDKVILCSVGAGVTSAALSLVW